MIEGRRRLALLEHSLDPSTFRRLEAIGVAPGWRCLDSITDIGLIASAFLASSSSVAIAALIAASPFSPRARTSFM